MTEDQLEQETLGWLVISGQLRLPEAEVMAEEARGDFPAIGQQPGDQI